MAVVGMHLLYILSVLLVLLMFRSLIKKKRHVVPMCNAHTVVLIPVLSSQTSVFTL